MPNENPRQRQLTGAATNLSARHWISTGKPTYFISACFLTIECVLNEYAEVVVLAVELIRLRIVSDRDTQRPVHR